MLTFLRRFFGYTGPSEEDREDECAGSIRLIQRYLALRWQYKEQGVYDGVIIDVLPLGSLLGYHYDAGTEVATIDEVGRLHVFTLECRRFWVVLRDIPYAEEAGNLARLREALPGADEYRAIWTEDGPFARRGYFAVRNAEAVTIR
jgi:hypothetical protein